MIHDRRQQVGEALAEFLRSILFHVALVLKIVLNVDGLRLATHQHLLARQEWNCVTLREVPELNLKWTACVVFKVIGHSWE